MHKTLVFIDTVEYFYYNHWAHPHYQSFYSEFADIIDFMFDNGLDYDFDQAYEHFIFNIILPEIQRRVRG